MSTVPYRGGTVNRYRPYSRANILTAARWGGRLARAAYNGYRAKRFKSDEPMANGTSIGTDNANTYQDSKTTIYSRRRMSKRKKRLFMKSKKNYERNLLKSLAMQKFNFETGTVTGIAPQSATVSQAVMINTGFDITNATDSPNSDYKNIFNLVGGNTTTQEMRLYQDSCMLQVHVTNTSAETLLFDVYTIYAKIDFEQSANTTYLTGFTDNIAKTAVPNPFGTNTSPSDQLTFFSSPFNQSLFGTKFTITKAERFQLSPNSEPNNTFSFNKRWNRNFTIKQSDFDTTASNMPTLGGKTCGFLIIARRSGSVSAELTNAFSIKSYRTYNIKYNARNSTTVSRVQGIGT